MKKLIFGIALIAITSASCNSGTNDSPATNKKIDDTTQLNNSSTSEVPASTKKDTKTDGSMKEMVSQYLEMKNALANDNGKDAATAGKAFVESMGKMDKASLAADQKKKWDDLSDDAKEMAEHIGKNADKIEHQREHFDMLSTDMYDLVKTFGAGQTLYKDFCPMYNNKKGAIWLSETKEIKNPLYGQKDGYLWISKRRNKTVGMNLFKILLVTLVVFVGIQFIRPAHNTSEKVLPTDITKKVNVPDKVLDVFKNSCYDCHSNNTRYPWYVNIQPMGWVMARHIKEGKENLNFSEFGAYSNRKQINKLRSIAESINEGSMPISSYTIMHTDAKLSEENKKLIADWATTTRDSLTIKN